MRLGLDVFSLRAQGLSAPAVLDFCAARGISLVHFSEPRFLGATEPAALRTLGSHAARLGLQVEVGMLSICPGATIFNPTAGTAEEQLRRTIDVAVGLQSRIVRCVVGSFRDREANGGIQRRVEEVLECIRTVRPYLSDTGVKLAIENHAGDLQSRELRALVEAAGPDVVGVCFDAGNALWALEDPRLALRTLAPYVLTTHTRDTAVRRTSIGADVAWTRMGEGNIDIGSYLDLFHQLCPQVTLTLEIIVMPAPRPVPYRTDAFWEGYREMRAWEFQPFDNLIASAPPVPLPVGPVSAEQELANVEASVAWTRAYLRQRRGAAAAGTEPGR